MSKLRQYAKKAARSGYSRLPWHTKLLVPVAGAGLLVYGLAELASRFL